jgi:hypothetical protein
MGSVQKESVGVARARARARIVLGVVLGISGAVASPAAVAVADSSSDIPGVPLSPGVVVGPLGGSIYDAVYSLDVAPGTVILAHLSGSSGTDFDLYLFDGSATTVVTNQGVIAKSTGPTSTESLSYAAPVGGRFYVDLNSATAAVGTYTLVVQVIPDRPPVVRLALGAGRARTNDTTVSVAVSASGSLSDAARMAFSADGITWQPWIAYQPATSWTFPDGDGTKTLWAKVENATGVASGPVSASILLDTERPGVTAVDPAINDDLVGTRPTITVTFSEPIDPESWTQLGLVVQTSGGVLVPGVFNVTAPTAGTFRPSDDLAAGRVYVLTVGAVRDVAGNLVAPSGSWVATDRPAPDLAVAASPRVVDRGATSLLSGRLTAPTGVASLTLEARPVGTVQAAALGSVPVAADGSFSARVTPSSTTEYLFHVPAAGGFGAGSVSAVVYVRRAVRLNWSSSTVRAGRVGARVSIVASVAPAAPGVGVVFRLERWSAVSRSWRLVGTLNRRTDVAGRASVTWTPSGSGLHRWRAIAGSTLDYSMGASAWVRWSIAR